MAKELLNQVHKVSLALFVFLLLVAGVFDLIAILPGLSVLISFFFILLVKLSLFMSGYHAGIMRMIITWIALMVFETVLSPVPTCTLYVITFYVFNSHMYAVQQKLLEAKMAMNSET